MKFFKATTTYYVLKSEVNSFLFFYGFASRGLVIFIKYYQLIIDWKRIFYVLRLIKKQGGQLLFFHSNFLIAHWLLIQLKKLRERVLLGTFAGGFIANFTELVGLNSQSNRLTNIQNFQTIQGMIFFTDAPCFAKMLNYLQSQALMPLFFFSQTNSLAIKRMDYSVLVNQQTFTFIYYFLILFCKGLR